MKILYVITGLEHGGAESSLYNLVTRLGKKYEPVVISLVSWGEIGEKLKKQGIKTYHLNYKPLIDIKSFFKLRKIIKEEKPDIIHSFMFHANMISRFAAIGLKNRLISSIRIVEREKPHHILIEKLTGFLVDQYTANSQAIKNKMKIKNLIVIPNGVELKPVSKKNSSKIPVIAMIGNLRKQKDYPTAIKAISLVIQKKKVKLVVAGKFTKFENELQVIKTLISELNLKNHVKLLGFTHDIPKLLSKSDIYLSTTLYEGQSNALMEAMAAAKPSIVTDLPENREVGGESVVYFEAGNSHSVAEAILEVLGNPKLANRLSESALKAIRTFDMKSFVQKHEELYAQ